MTLTLEQASRLAHFDYNRGYSAALALLRTIDATSNTLLDYRDDFDDFLTEWNNGSLDRRQYPLPTDRPSSAHDLLLGPAAYARTVTTAFRWMRDATRGPWATAAIEAPNVHPPLDLTQEGVRAPAALAQGFADAIADDALAPVRDYARTHWQWGSLAETDGAWPTSGRGGMTEEEFFTGGFRARPTLLAGLMWALNRDGRIPTAGFAPRTTTTTLSEGAPMTISLTLATDIANSIGLGPVPPGIEAYATEYDEFTAWDRDHEQRGLLTMQDLISFRERGTPANSVGLFMQWLREQGRGPFAATVSLAAEQTVGFATVAHLEHGEPVTWAEFEPWLPTFTRWVNEVGHTEAAMERDWLTNTADLSTLATIRGTATYDGSRAQGFHRLPATRRRFASWLRLHGQTAPDPVVPQGNSFDFDLPMHQWSIEQRRAIFPDVLDWQVARRGNGDRDYQRRNVGYALVPEDHDGGTDGVWSSSEWSPLAEFRVDVRSGAFRLTHAVATADVAAAPADVAAAAEPAADLTVVPIGPDHPDWHRFAQQMADVATRAGMCPEFDRIARLMGLPTRKTRIVTKVTLEIPVEIERGNNVDDRTLREAAKALLEQSGAISRSNREELRREEVVGY